ncbi:hypothetical protein B0H19DRAFT_1074397 [Mycena capillaripes]|nr:hypothetical protein B0H19DRAFT_1074397 [Mycena capillaripes]
MVLKIMFEALTLLLVCQILPSPVEICHSAGSNGRTADFCQQHYVAGMFSRLTNSTFPLMTFNLLPVPSNDISATTKTKGEFPRYAQLSSTQWPFSRPRSRKEGPRSQTRPQGSPAESPAQYRWTATPGEHLRLPFPDPPWA